MQVAATRQSWAGLLSVPGFLVGAYVCASINATYTHFFGESHTAPRILIPAIVSLVLAALPLVSKRVAVRWAAVGAAVGVVLVSLAVYALSSMFGDLD